MMFRSIFILCFIHLALYGSKIPNFDDLSKSKDVTIMLTTPRSGSNLISASLTALTRKPISWLDLKNKIFDPIHRNHPSYNRIGLPLVSEIPLLYRTHSEFSRLMKFPSQFNKLIFVSRNPKELLYREFFLKAPRGDNPSPQFIKSFLDTYLQAMSIFDAWCSETRMLVFYEDFIQYDDEILLQLLQFMGEEPVFYDDYIANKQEYLSRMLESYTKQHVDNSGGASSSTGGPKAIYYTEEASLRRSNLSTHIYGSKNRKFGSPILNGSKR